MLRHAREACELLGSASREDLAGDRVMQLALTKLVEIVGEAANRVAVTTQQAHPEIPWAQMVGTRNRLTHAYDVIDYDVLWDTVRDDLPTLIAQLEGMVSGRA